MTPRKEPQGSFLLHLCGAPVLPLLRLKLLEHLAEMQQELMELAEVFFLDGEQVVRMCEEVADALGIRLAGTKIRVHDEPAFFVERDEGVELALHAVEVVDEGDGLQDVAPRAVADLESCAERTEPLTAHLHVVADLVVHVADIAEADDIHELLVVGLELLVLLHGPPVVGRFLLDDTVDVLDVVLLLVAQFVVLELQGLDAVFHLLHGNLDFCTFDCLIRRDVLLLFHVGSPFFTSAYLMIRKLRLR